MKQESHTLKVGLWTSATLKSWLAVSSKLKMCLTHDPVVLLLGTLKYTQENRHKNVYYSIITARTGSDVPV